VKDPVISLCVCTLAGSERIADTLWSLSGQSADADRYEILVIENDSAAAEATRSVVDGMKGRARDIRLVIEPRTGLSHARNRAIQESRGDYVFFIDDDAIATPRLVESFINAIEGHSPDVIGGNVLPLFEVMPPPELEYAWWSHWSLKHFGDRDRWLAEGEYFLGTNIGASRQLLLEQGFDSHLGRSGDDLMGGEEWFLGSSRFRRRFVSGALVFHQVTAARMTPEYLVKRMFYGTQSRQRRQRESGEVPQLSALDILYSRLVRSTRQLGLLGRKILLAWRIRQERRRFMRKHSANTADQVKQ
jgi:glycosyltransferase involved in cell wall biosynthesis